MSLIADISEHLVNRNALSLNKATNLANKVCHAWFLSHSRQHSECSEAHQFLKQNSAHPVVHLIDKCSPLIDQELSGMTFPKVDNPLWALFSPEAINCQQQAKVVEERIQTDRTITKITKPELGLVDVANELLLTSNVLLSPPLNEDDISHIPLGEAFHHTVEKARQEAQEFWYDHPIPIGISVQENEIIYGLKHLDKALETELSRGNLIQDSKLTVVLSCSVTHPSLAQIAKDYVEYEIQANLTLKHLNVAVLSENECQSILKSTIPSASASLKNVFGVNGAYGRHYSLLKAIAPLWKKAINPQLKATFKIDLDQVFDQEMLIQETEKSAFEHLINSNWGARGVDANGDKVYLGMIAGGLVNESDKDQGLFTSDIPLPDGDDYLNFEQLFCTRWSQAISTQQEIISKRSDIQRRHVTGGTNGILIEALYKYRPFTPTFIHRAEDQAYILSVLAKPIEGEYLVVSHQPGLIMRHDKSAFAGRAMAFAQSGKALGDIERILLFSAYASHHALDIDELKEKLYPFTGMFMSKTPVTLALLRFLLDGYNKDEKYLCEGALRLANSLDYCNNSLFAELVSNKKGWNEYYDYLANSEITPLAQHVLSNCLLNLG